MKKLQDKVAIVTGASKGIGAEIAKQLAGEGAKVVVNYASSAQGAEKVVAAIKSSGGTAVAVQGDVSKKKDIEKLFAETKKAFGKLDVLVNNAGVYAFVPLDSMTEEQFHNMFNINVLGTLLATQEALKYFGDKGGSVINISSVASDSAPANASAYSATKGAVDSVTKSLAKELGPRKIRVNAVNPGMVITEGVHAAGFTESAFRKQLEQQTPLGRVAEPDDVAPAVVFLASDESGWITGETIRVAGGFR